MTNTSNFRLMIDNSTVAGAGRALYDTSPYVSDCRSLMHLITAALFCDEIYIDGSSRVIPVRIYDAEADEDRITEPLPVVWTWEKRYPVISKFCSIVDGFWQRALNFDNDKIVDFALKVLAEGGDEHINHLDLDLIPSIYLSNDYFDRDWLNARKAMVDSQMGSKLSESSFKVLLYAWRGIYYYELSKLLGITYFAHPQRSKFIELFMVAGKSIYDYDNTALTFLSKAICDPVYKQVQALVAEKSKESAISLFPFAAYVLKYCRTSSREEIIERVAMLRGTDQVQELRGWISEYDIAYRQNDILNLKKFQSKVNSSMRNFEKRYGLESASLKIVPRMPINSLGISGLEKISASLNLPGFLFTELFQKPYMSWMWDMAEGLLSGDRGLNKIARLSPVSESQRDIEWILMEVGGRHLSGGDYYLKGHVAGPGDKNLHGYDSYEDLLVASDRPAKISSLTEFNKKDAERMERMDRLHDLNEISQKRKLTPDENETLLEVFEDSTDREKMTASWAIETSGSPEAAKELLNWENEYIRRQLGYDDRDDEDIIPPKNGSSRSKQKKEMAATKPAWSRKKISKKIEQVKIEWEGKSFCKGDRVRIYKLAGTIKPEESGHPEEIELGLGNTGTFLGGVKRTKSKHFTPEPNEPIQLALVKWDKQVWVEHNTGKKIPLQGFVGAIHADYLELV